MNEQTLALIVSFEMQLRIITFSLRQGSENMMRRTQKRMIQRGQPRTMGPTVLREKSNNKND
jgi:hypothetical protein